MGAFIVFEGGEGAGKSTQARILARRLSQEGFQVVSTREPGGTALGEVVRRWLKSRAGLTPLAELLLFTAARAQLVKVVIGPALRSSQRVVISDRFTASTVAYQGFGRGVDLELIHRLNEASTQGLRPDLTVYLDLPVEAGLARKRGGLDNFEAEGTEFHRRVREGYLTLVSEDPEGWLVVDGNVKRKAVAAQIWARTRHCL